MFDTENVACYLDDLSPRTMKDKAGDEVKVWDLGFRIAPLTPKLAAEIHDAVRGTLFKRSDAEVTEFLERVVFRIPQRPQAIVFRADPDIEPSFDVDEAKISRLTAKKEKGSPAWILMFRLTLAHLDGAGLLFLQDALFKQWFLTLANAVPGLFDEEEKKARRSRRAAAGAGEVTAH